MDIYNRGKYNLDHKGFFTKCILLTRTMGYLAFLVTVAFFTKHFVDYLYRPPLFEYMACENVLIGDKLATLLLNKTELYTCSTTNTRRKLPCMCCVRGECWRSVEIHRNSSDLATYYDQLKDGRILVRKIPEFMIVSYTPLKSSVPFVKKEDGPVVGDILRARELLYNWPHAGEETRDEL